MNSYFSIGELSKHQNISRQTLIYYDKIGLFCPAYTDPSNGYRYYSSAQLDYLDTILILKKIGFSLEQIKEHMKNYTMESSIAALQKQLVVISRRMEELQMLKSRIKQRCTQMERSLAAQKDGGRVTLEQVEKQYILLQPVQPPHTLEDVSLATKQCFVRAFKEQLPVYFQSGAVVPYANIRAGRYTEAAYAFLPMEKPIPSIPEVQELPAGRCVSTHHIGDYLSIGKAYERILDYCAENGLEIRSDSYEFAMNDYLSTKDEQEYVTKILFYVR